MENDGEILNILYDVPVNILEIFLVNLLDKNRRIFLQKISGEILETVEGIYGYYVSDYDRFLERASG